MLTWTDNLGWLLLGVAAWRTGILGWPRAFCVAYMAVHASGVLKGFTVWGVVGDVLLCFAFVTLGVEMLRANRDPAPATAQDRAS